MEMPLCLFLIIRRNRCEFKPHSAGPRAPKEGLAPTVCIRGESREWQGGSLLYPRGGEYEWKLQSVARKVMAGKNAENRVCINGIAVVPT